jgi:hypothetical protein
MKMTYKRILQNQIQDMYCVINQFNNNNPVVIERWTNRFGYTYEMIVNETNDLIQEYNKKYGKRFGCINLISIFAAQ